MYYEEEIIDGVLMWRGSPDGEWQPVKGVAEQYLAQKEVIPALEHRIAEMEREVQMAQDAVVNAEKLVHAAQTDYYRARERAVKLEDALEPFADAAPNIPEDAEALDIDFMLNGQADCTTVAFEGIAFHRARALLTQKGGDDE